MASRTTDLLLKDIMHSADKILMYTRGMNYYDFSPDVKTVDAVVRNIEIMSEAVAKIPDNFKSEHPEIDWQDISHFSERTILDTSIIDYEVAWRIREENASDLLSQVREIANDKKN